MIHRVLQFCSVSPSIFCKLMKCTLKRRQNWYCTSLASFSFGVLCFWFIALLRHCARLVVEKEMSNYLSVCFSLPHFLTPLQTPPKHLLNITMLVCPNWCVI